MSSEPLRLFVLTRPTTWAAMGIVRLLPLCLLLAFTAVSDAPPDAALRAGALLGSLALVALFWWVERRCSRHDEPYRDGLLVIAASVSLGWMAMDIVFVLCAVILAQWISCVLALTGDPPARFQRLVAWFYRHRMYQ